MKNLAFTILLILFALQGDIYAQNSVSIGTEEINDNAVLQLVSQNNNQGFLVPRLSTALREAMQLGADDNGMLVYDNELGRFFYWQNNSWIQITNGAPLIAGEAISISSNNEITNLLPDQVVSLAGEGSTTITGTYPNFTIASDPDDADADVTNEIQNIEDVLLQGNNANNQTITGLSDPVDNTDAANKEYVDDQISGTWSISGNDNIVAGNYIGTTNDQDLRLRTNAQNRMIIDGTTGNVGINNNPNSQYKLYVGITTDHATDAAICGYAYGSNDIYGLRGGTFSNDDDAAGVHGFAGSGHGETYGVSGVTYSVDDNSAGVYGYANNIGGGRTYGVYGVSASPNGIGIYGRGSDWAGYFVGRVYATGTITQNSDKRLKKDIADLNDAYTKLYCLRGVYYYWNTEKYPEREYSSDRQIGVIAQELEKVFPELVEDVDGFKSVNYSGLIPVLIEVAKKQQTIIESQKDELDELRSRIESIESLLQELNGDK